MLEKHRLRYLDMLGIENYMPRYQLSNALPSQLLSDDALLEPTAFSTADSETPVSNIGDDSPITSPVNEPVNPSSVAVVDGEVADVLAVLTQEQTSPPMDDIAALINVAESSSIMSEVSVVEESANHAIVADNQPAIRFSLNVWRIHNDLIVIDTRQPAAALPTDKLLQNILRSIGYALAQLPPSELLRWPLFKARPVKNVRESQTSDEDEARAMVQAYLSAHYSKMPVKTLLLLGEDAVRFALTPDQASNDFYNKHKGTQISDTPWKSTVLVAPSLVDMLHDPMQKHITWQALQALLRSSEES